MTASRTGSATVGRVLGGLGLTLAAGLIGAGLAWLLLSRELAAMSASFREATGVELGIGIGASAGQIRDYGLLVAGLGLLAWLLAARPGTTWLRSALVACGTFAVWVAVVWGTMADLTMDWPGPVAPISCTDQGEVGCAMARVASPEAFAGPVTVLVVLLGATWLGVRFSTRRRSEDEPGQAPAAPAAEAAASSAVPDLAARVLVGGATLLGLAGVAALLLLAWAGLGAGSAWSELASAPYLTTVLAVLVAWTVSGSGRGTTVLVLVAAVLLVRPLDPPVPLGALAVLLGIVTAVIASARRPVAELLRRMST